MSTTPTIMVFPNSGHHFDFIPIPDATLNDYEGLREAILTEQYSHWLVPDCPGYTTEQLGTPSLSQDPPWVRFCLGKKGTEVGMWVAVESNLGDATRGVLLGETETTGEIRADLVTYAAQSPNQLRSGAIRFTPGVEIVGVCPEVALPPFEVVWQNPGGEELDVDLVVDFGNTRTVAFAIEHAPGDAQGGLASICRFIRFLDRGFEYEPPNSTADLSAAAIVDSWFVIRESWFSQFDPHEPGFKPVLEHKVETTIEPPTLVPPPPPPPKSFFGTPKPPPPAPQPPPPISVRRTTAIRRMPHSFVEVSPVVMGDHASSILGAINLENGGLFSLSSPKRFIWDVEPVGRDGSTYWMMHKNAWRQTVLGQMPVLQGLICGYSYGDGRDWDVDHPPFHNPTMAQRPLTDPKHPSFPRRDTVVWAALHILEQAYRQITSSGYRRLNKQSLPRRLRSVSVTYPSGWIAEEREAYQKLWQRALDIFMISRFPESYYNDSARKPRLNMDLDEAVASQLPFVYSEIKRLGNKGENWISLFGRPTTDETGHAVRIITVDIGGGTTDICVSEYRDMMPGVNVAMDFKVLFKDSNTYAGDRVVKRLIEGALLPSLLRAKGIGGSSHEQAADLEHAFSAPHMNETSREKWARITKLVFVPLIRQWLSDFGSDRSGNPKTGLAWCLGDLMGPQGPLVDQRALLDLNDFLALVTGETEFVGMAVPIDYDPALLERLIRSELEIGLRPISKYVSAFDVDLVVLSGKLSELPVVKKMLDEFLPILPARIVSMKDYLAGDWYPLGKNGRVSDAKSVTAVGAALYRGIKNGLIQGWSTNGTIETDRVKNAWGAMQDNPLATGFGAVYLKPGDDQAIVALQRNAYIGRQRFLSRTARPEQQYRLVPKTEQKSGPIKVLFKRRNTGADGLEIEKVWSFEDGTELPPDSVELQLCTLEASGFWLDSGRFHLSWES
jgi:hypothetical protein